MHIGLHAALALISKQQHLLMTTHAVNTVQIKVNGKDPYMAMVYLSNMARGGVVYCQYTTTKGCTHDPTWIAWIQPLAVV